MTTRITVIMPVRNGAATLSSALGSVLRSLPRDGRVVVHDDASTDSTGEVLRALRDPRVSMIRSDEPRGVAGGLNLLLAEVSTPLVARMDADDIVLPWRFETQRAALTRGSDVTFTTVLPFGRPFRQLRPGPPLPITAEAMPLHLILSNPVAHSTMLARTEVLVEAGGYHPVAAEDYELWLRLAAEGRRIVRTGAPGLLYRVHSGQVTAGAGWAAAALAEPAVVTARAALCRRVLDVRPDLRLQTGDDPELAPSALAAALRRAGSTLPRLQRQLLYRKIESLDGSTSTS